jgi:phosphate transport system protein
LDEAPAGAEGAAMNMLMRREVDNLRRLVLAMSAFVEEALQAAIRAALNRDAADAKSAVEADAQVDIREVDIEEECLKILALYAPVADDLRYIVAILKINHDLERVGDLTVNIAERATSLSREAPVAVPFDLQGLADRARHMIAGALDAMIRLDADLARTIWLSDDEADQIHREAYARVRDAIRNDPARIEAYLSMLSISRNLERIADHATNIAKDVLYIVKGEIFRHRARQFKARLAPPDPPPDPPPA